MTQILTDPAAIDAMEAPELLAAMAAEKCPGRLWTGHETPDGTFHITGTEGVEDHPHTNACMICKGAGLRFPGLSRECPGRNTYCDGTGETGVDCPKCGWHEPYYADNVGPHNRVSHSSHCCDSSGRTPLSVEDEAAVITAAEDCLNKLGWWSYSYRQLPEYYPPKPLYEYCQEANHQAFGANRITAVLRLLAKIYISER